MAVRRVVTRRVVTSGESAQEHKVREAVPYVLSAEFIYWVLGIMEGLLAIRFFFRLAGANPLAGFTQFVYGVTGVLMAPFRLIFPTGRVEGAIFEWSILVAMVVYWLLAWTLLKLVDMFYTAEQAD